MLRRLKSRLLVCVAILPGALFCASYGTASPAAVGSSGSIYMETTQVTSRPAGHVSYCANEPEACYRYGDGLVVLTEESWRQLIDVNRQVNQNIAPVADGQMDIWSVYVTEGDCEDFALTKQRELLRLGWPSDSLLITTAYLPDGTYHAVLLVRTDRGEFVLDNLNELILPWQKVDYRWNKRQAVGNPEVWQSIAGAPVDSGDGPVAGLSLRPSQ